MNKLTKKEKEILLEVASTLSDSDPWSCNILDKLKKRKLKKKYRKFYGQEENGQCFAFVDEYGNHYHLSSSLEEIEQKRLMLLLFREVGSI